MGDIKRDRAKGKVPPGTDKPGLVVIANNRPGIPGDEVIKPVAQRGLHECGFGIERVLMHFTRHHAVLTHPFF